MLNDFNAWFRSSLESIIPFGFTDAEFKTALSNCYTALCHNKYQEGRLSCPLKLDDVGAVIISYIAYFRMAANTNSKYYYDEYSDRSDPYRKGLLIVLTEGAQKISKSVTVDFTNDVLSYLYWSMKRGKCPKSILRPRGEPKFELKNWYINEPYRSIVSISESVYNAVIKVFEVASRAVKVVIDGVEQTLDLANHIVSGASSLITNLPYILSGGIVLFAGIQIYGKRKNGKFYGEATAKRFFIGR